MVAIGGISLLEQQQARARRPDTDKTGGRIVDLIASAQQSTVNQNKLDYIIEFMRANKLTKFCDLLTSDQPEVATLRAQLNSIDKFTLFVPTNEALLLMPSDELGLLRSRPLELRRFLAAHATDELVVPRLNLASLRDSQLSWPLSLSKQIQAAAQSATRPSLSLARTPLRISTTSGRDQNHSQAPARASKLDLIVNGANVISGQSYALQEPNNSSATYAVVHLIDRALYPPPSLNLLERARLSAPKWASYVELAQDSRLNEALESSAKLYTLFLPNDDAFRSTPAKLLGPLDTNRTYLVEFLLSHLLEGLFYTGQLEHRASKLPSLGKLDLEFETKTIQSRSLVLVNSIPISEGDKMALNGVIHLITRPIFEQNLLHDCNCLAGNSSTLGPSSWPTSSSDLAAYERQWARHSPRQPEAGLSRAGAAPVESLPTGNELEREESQPVGRAEESSARVRAQRSGSLVARNNRDFYRPSAAPANLLLGQLGSEKDPLVMSASRNSSQPPVALLREESTKLGPFDAERYKIVMNATLRQKLREQQLRGQQEQAPSGSLFSYDRSPLGADPKYEVGTETSNARHAYSPAPENSSNWSAGSSLQQSELQPEQMGSLSSSRQQRLLKFQPEDARDLAPRGDRTLNASLQPAYEMGPDERWKSQQVRGKTLAPPGFTGCAFYDAECKRLVNKLVHLPSRQARLKGASSNLSSLRVSPDSQLFDSTFGETTDRPQPVFIATTPLPALVATNSSANRQPASFNRLTRPRVSPLSQPLPPWSDEEHRLANQAVWRPQDGQQDLARLNAPQGAPFASSLNRESQRQATQILFVPVRMIQDTITNLSSIEQPAIFVSPAPSSRLSQLNQPTLRPSTRPMLGSQHQNFHTPTPYSVSPVTTHLPPIFGRPIRLNNLTKEDLSSQQLQNGGRFQLQQQQQHQQQSLSVPLSPSAFRKQKLQQLDNNGPVQQSSDSSSLGGFKEPRKVVHLQPTPAGLMLPHGDYFNTGDISVTTAQLLANPNATSGLAAQASTNQLRAPSSQDQSNDFFQNRTIGDIMDDSGLRIDNQQVTFTRLKRCLADAELLSLVTQTGSALTIFMPTDMAFQRLVQQQAFAHQRERPTSGLSARLTDHERAHLVPLIVKRDPSETARSEMSGRLVDLNDSLLTSGGASVADRLTLDCSSNKVRQILLDHMSARLITPKQLQKDMIISSLSSRQLILSSVPSKKIVVIDGQPVIAATRAKNGMVYVVNKFLNLTQQVPNVVDLLETQPNLTTFMSYLNFSSMADRLRRGK